MAPKSNKKKKNKLSQKDAGLAQGKQFAAQGRQLIPRNVRTKFKSSLTLQDKCVARYLVAMVDPFNPAATGACLPDNSAVQTVKFSVYYRGTFSVPSGNRGAFVWGPTPSNTTAGVYSHVAAGTTPITASQCLTPSGVGKGSPFTGAMFGHGLLEYRVVGAGIRVQCVSAPLNTSGVIGAFTTPSSSLISSAFDYDDILAQSTSLIRGNREIVTKPFTQAMGFDDPREQGRWESNVNEWTGLGNGVGMVAPSADDESYYYTTIAHFEARGRDVTQLTTESEGDPAACAQAFTAANRVNKKPDAQAEPVEQRMERAFNIMNNLLVGIGRTAYTAQHIRSFLGYGPPSRHRLEL